MKTQKTKLGALEMQLLSYAQLRKKDILPLGELAPVDAVYDWTRYNTLPRACGWIAETLKKDPAIIENLIGDTLQYGNKGTVKRIGYCLAQLGVSDDRLSKMKRHLGSAKSLIPWIPSQAAKGSVNKEWGLIVNGVFPQ